DVQLADLKSFFANPARAFLRQLDVSTPLAGDEVKDSLPLDLDALERWTIGDRMIAQLQNGADPQAVCDAELFRGELPPEELGVAALRDVTKVAHSLMVAAQPVLGTPPRSIDVEVCVGEGRLLGSVASLRGNALVSLVYSRVGAKNLLPAWLDLLACTVAHPGWEGTTYHLLGKASRGNGITHATLGPVTAEFARRHLQTLVELRERGLREPLPVPIATGRAWAMAVADGDDPERYAGDTWHTARRSPVPGEQDDASFARIYGRRAPLRRLVGLGDFAVQMWGPLLPEERFR
ncbi:MAG: exodeoxyribonuclease V subunit gamma, partial [Actinomycetota bacterium]|nr:exodeoxyribonuclease V subunit gamma [Actinomycetota bacterium]